jgi:hypothetical protein
MKLKLGCLKVAWGDQIGPAHCPYLRRWVIECPLFSVRLHHWLASDDTRHYHDHGWNFLSILLWGHLIDKSPTGVTNRRWLVPQYFPATHQHMVIVKRKAWTIMLCGRNRRIWGYWVNGKFRKRNKYFYEHGHHDPCGPVVYENLAA